MIRPAINLVRRYSKVIDLKQRSKDIKPTLITDKYSIIRDKYEIPKYPIVLCHGFSGFDTFNFIPRPLATAERKVEGFLQINYWHGIRESLEKLGCTVLIGKVPPFGTIEDRATILHNFINERCGKLKKRHENVYNENNGQAKISDKEINEEEIQPRKQVSNDHSHSHRNGPIKINLVSHSMGGLDSRYLISQLQSPENNYKVVSLTTISTPHHGSECADFLEDTFGSNRVTRLLLPPPVYEMTTENMKQFNKKIVDDPSVQYFSYGAQFYPKWYNVFNLTWKIVVRQIRLKYGQKAIDKLSTYNDGVVSVESSKWGTYLGTLDEVDHLDLINWTNRTRVALDRVLFNKRQKFNALALYLDIADNLAKTEEKKIEEVE